MPDKINYTKWLQNLLLVEPERVQFNYCVRRGLGSLPRIAYGYVRPFLGQHVVEFSAGTGWLKDFWHIANYTGVDNENFQSDFQRQAQEMARRNGVLEIDAAEFCCHCETPFDTCVWYESIQDYREETLDIILRDVLASGGHAIIVGPTNDSGDDFSAWQSHFIRLLDHKIPSHWIDFAEAAAMHLEIIDALEQRGHSRKEILQEVKSLPPQLLMPLREGLSIAELHKQVASLDIESVDLNYRIRVLQKRHDKAAPLTAPVELFSRNFPVADVAAPATEANSCEPIDDICWNDAQTMNIEGKGWINTLAPYDRLPAHARDLLHRRAWQMSRCSAGLCVRFRTESPRIVVSWKALTEWLPHMAPSGMRGIDLYARSADGWRWVATGMPDENSSQAKATLVSNPLPRFYEYLLYFPVCSILQSLQIGISRGFELLPPSPSRSNKPLCFYGTSFTQGASASRPGMAYPAIIGRWMDRPVINLGLSGSGKMEPIMAQLLAELDCSMYILDCIPNMLPKRVKENFYPFVASLRSLRPETPILLMDNPHYTDSWFSERRRDRCEQRSEIVANAYQALCGECVSGIDFIPGHLLLGSDGEATVANHSTDLGFMRAAEVIFPFIRRLLV